MPVLIENLPPRSKALQNSSFLQALWNRSNSQSAPRRLVVVKANGYLLCQGSPVDVALMSTWFFEGHIGRDMLERDHIEF